jgi:hypothetical protein
MNLKRVLMSLLTLAAMAAIVVPAFAAGTGRRYYSFTVVDEFDEPVADAVTWVLMTSAGSDVSSACYTTANGPTAVDVSNVTTGEIGYWSAQTTMDIRVTHDANTNASELNDAVVTDHKIMLPKRQGVTGATTYTGTVTGIAGTWTGTQTWGVDATGVDTQWYGDTTVNSMLWDYSDDRLELTAAE